jgi:ABC-type branched-subunit amino acid transport system ATPase component
MLRLNALTSGYRGRPVLLGIDLEIADGQSLALLGRNGVGKSTLLKTVIGHVATTSGELSLDERDLTQLATHERARAGIAFVPQGRDVFAGMSVTDNLRVAAQAAFGRHWREQLNQAFTEFPALARMSHASADGLSGGQQQILAIARALVGQPRILVLDEPSEGIAPAMLDEIVDLIRDVQARRGLSVLIAEQNLDFAAGIAETSVVLERGVIATRVSTREIQECPELHRRLLAI